MLCVYNKLEHHGLKIIPHHSKIIEWALHSNIPTPKVSKFSTFQIGIGLIRIDNLHCTSQVQIWERSFPWLKFTPRVRAFKMSKYTKS